MKRTTSRYARPTGQRSRQEHYEATAGWCQPFPDARYHYFKRGSVRSLCGALLYSGAPRDDANDDRALACNACHEQVQALRKQTRKAGAA